MRIKTFLVPLIAGTIFLSACSKNFVSLSYTNAKGEVPQLGNLIFRFSQSMVKDSMLNAWDSTDYISFEPAINGKFRWENPDQLVFSPSQPLNPATSYKATIKKAVLKFSKYNDLKDADKIDFHTPDLTMDNSQGVWIGESGTSALPQLDLFFNYRIKPEDLKDKLTVEVDGKKIDFNMITVSPDNKISVRITGLKPEDKDYVAKVIIEKGLIPESGVNSITEPIIASLSIPSPYVLTIQNVESQHDGTEGVVTVTTSQQLTGESLKSFVKFDPSVTYTVESNENGFTIRSEKFDVEKSYALTIAKGLRGKIGGVLKEDYGGSVAFGQLEANISFTNSKAVYLSRKGSKNIEVQITNVPKVKLIISKIYENNLLMSQRYGYYPKETRAEQASYNEDSEGDYYNENSSDAMHVYIKQDSSQQPVKVETDENLQDLIEIREDNGVLYISPVDNYNLDPTRQLKVYVAAPLFKGIGVSGASRLYSENKLTSSETLDIDLSGASEIKLDVKAPRVNSEISGASSAVLTGETKDFSANGSGASNYKCFDLMTENTTVDISGACSADVFASVKLDVQASGASEVKYRGAAAITQDLSGASGIRKVD